MGRNTAAILDPQSVAETRRALAAKFRAAGIESADLDARILIGQALRADQTALASDSARSITPAEQAMIDALARRRLDREPIARIVGQKEFWSLLLRLNSATLVPRPETETVVEAALAAIDARGSRSRPLQIADLGTASRFRGWDGFEYRRACRCPRQCSPSWPRSRGIRSLRYGAGLARPVRSDRVESTLHRIR
jgi:N5-glutamine AdoMet-dependent methyltransferase PrmC (HemK)-like protein